MSNDLQLSSPIENALMRGDLSRLTEAERLSYYKSLCASLSLNALTQPLIYITLNGKLTLYVTKGCTEQLRGIHKVSIKITSRESIEGVYVVTAEASLPDGRCDSATGAVTIQNLKGEMLANAFMKAETKAKRRVTLSLLGLNMLDESEVEDIPNVNKQEVKPSASPKLESHAGKTPPLTHPIATPKLDDLGGTATTAKIPTTISTTLDGTTECSTKTIDELKQEVRKHCLSLRWGRKELSDYTSFRFQKDQALLTQTELIEAVKELQEKVDQSYDPK